jgi:tetratricopeptide (TPR) repeat protein
MATIRIQERAGGTDEFQAAISFNNGPEYALTINNPFTQEEDDQLAWYFEGYLRFPFTDQVKAREAAGSIARYGESLFKQVFEENHNVYARYKAAVQAGLSTMQFEIAGSPLFHTLHWEALKDPELRLPLALQATMVRKNLNPSTIEAGVRPSPTINLLIVTARPSGRSDVGYRTISRPLVEALRQANLPVQIDILRPGTYKALEKHLRQTSAQQQEGYYQVIHFDLHGSVLTYEQLQQVQEASRHLYNERYGRLDIQPYEGVKAFLAFEGAEDTPVDRVEASELTDLLVTHQVPVAILNACQSGKQIGASETSLGSRLMQAGVQLVLAMGYSVTVSAAELLMQTLYQHLFAGEELSAAIRHARTELYNHKSRRAYFEQRIDLEDWLLPVVYQNQPVQVQPREFTPGERAAWFERKAEEQRYSPPEPHYGFVGRDLDILEIERRLLLKRNLLLVRGMGGAGKTTLLRHLGAWWHTTGFVERVFYFGYDEKAWTLEQLMMEMARQLYGPQYYTNFQPLSLAARQAMLAHELRSANHLLILDNLESITGAELAIQHTLPADEQARLRSFLADLAKGRTLVLLGSRGGEDWLAKGTFEDNVYELPGLDPEAASTLADRILEKYHVTTYREDADFQKLLKLLDGFPLALEVVLANLARQAPGEVLAALQAGDVKLDTPGSQEKTESILRCIDYSHSNLSPEAQQLLLCLAPFTSVIWLDMLDDYTEQLRQQPALASLPFERWPEVIQEAQNWGLLSPDSAIPSFLRLQPIFPYFLRSRLQEPAQAEVKQAVERAFREYYQQLGSSLDDLLSSQDAQQRRVGQLLAGLEYENLVTALNLALEAQASIAGYYEALLEYLKARQDPRRALALFQSILDRFERYPAEKLAGPLGVEFANVLGTTANWQRELKQYEAAETSYQKILRLATQLGQLDQEAAHRLQASTYHNLGMVAQEQRQWEQAEQFYQQALQLFSEYNDRYSQAKTYHQLGRVAQEQRQWAQAEEYYQQALQLFIEHNDRYSQANTYHNLGAVAQEQRKFEQAAQYYQQALQLYSEYNDRYSQANTYHNLGILEREQEQWTPAREYLLRALEIYVDYQDRENIARTLRNVALLWQSSHDADLPAAIATMLGASREEIEAVLRKYVE